MDGQIQIIQTIIGEEITARAIAGGNNMLSREGVLVRLLLPLRYQGRDPKQRDQLRLRVRYTILDGNVSSVWILVLMPQQFCIPVQSMLPQSPQARLRVSATRKG